MLLVRSWREEWDIKMKSADVSSFKSTAETAEATDPGLMNSPRAAGVALTSPEKPPTVRTGCACLMYLAPDWCGVNVSLLDLICLARTSLPAGSTGGHSYRARVICLHHWCVSCHYILTGKIQVQSKNHISRR